LPAGRRVAALEAGGRLIEAAVAVRVEPPCAAARASEGALALDHLHVGFGQLIDEARRRRCLPQAAVAPVLHKADLGLPPRACQADISKAPLLLETRLPALVEAALVRKQPFLPAGEEHDAELQAFGSVKRHQRDAV